jgi:hypothetical protein
MIKMDKKKKIRQLEEKLKKYEKKLADKRLGYGEVVRTRFGDSYQEQLDVDTNALEGLILSIKEELASLKKK